MFKSKISGALVLGAALVALLSAPAKATVVYGGSTEGCFGTCTPQNSATDNGLTFNGTTFSNVTAGTSFDLGTFTLQNGTNSYDETFDLLVTFTAPAGSGNGTFTADLSGAVHGNSGDPSVSVTFTDSPQPFNGFTLSLTDLTNMQPSSHGNVYDITGLITVTAAVPEPSTWAMMLLGFMGIGFMAYRRKSVVPAFRVA
jgi:hypothetical protein